MPKINDFLKKERKNLILEHAFEAFSEKGYAAVTMNDIATRAGVSKGGIYTYFASKEELFLTIAQRRLEIRQQLVRSLPPHITCTEKVHRYLTEVLAWIFDMTNLRQIKFTYEFWAVTAREPAMGEQADQRYLAIAQDLESILSDGIARGEFISDLDVPATCFVILSSLDGITFVSGVMGIRHVPQIPKAFIRMVMSLLTQTPQNSN